MLLVGIPSLVLFASVIYSGMDVMIHNAREKARETA